MPFWKYQLIFLPFSECSLRVDTTSWGIRNVEACAGEIERRNQGESAGIKSHVGHIDGLVQDCSISTALAVEILQSCTEPSTCIRDPMSIYRCANTLELHLSNIDGLVQDCSISSALAVEILQSCTEPSTCNRDPMSIYIDVLTHWSYIFLTSMA